MGPRIGNLECRTEIGNLECDHHTVFPQETPSAPLQDVVVKRRKRGKGEGTHLALS